ncbi:unnamed protein product, partial [Porites evermanni]
MAKEYNLKELSSLFEEKLSERSGLVKNVKAAESVLREFETTTTTRYACFKASKGFGNTDIKSHKHKVLWEDGSLRFDHIPFVVVNHKVCDCQHGVDRHVREKKRNQSVSL